MDNSLVDPVEEGLYEHYRIVADKGQSPLRIDKFLFNRIESVSRNKIQKAAEDEMVFVNDIAVKSNYKIKPGDVIRVMLPEPKMEHDVEPENIALNIIYEDDDIVVVNKPPGLVVHPGVGNYTGTLVNGLVYHFQNLPAQKKNEFRPGLVHRIDKNTSGLLVVAKNEHAMNFLGRQFSDHSIQRTYQAIVWGTFKQLQGTVTGNIGRSLKNRKMMDVFPDGDYGKEAVTHYTELQNLSYVSLIECRLETGRTHQIRAHMKFISHPVFNDETYGGDKIVKGTVYSKYKQFVESCFQVIPRHALHAKSLGFIHPSSRQFVFFDSDLPADFSTVLKKWQTYMKAKM
ncbi:MAG: RluA family pseudouridine synthase [Chitinophagales bacterium]|nr:RluA family pseudouridine synthase [Chitinophagales bacterium]